jgi:hypothetical protein
MDVVLIPCWRRDDFLTVTLHHLQRAEGAGEHLYVFCVDVKRQDPGVSRDVLSVISEFPLRKEVLRHESPFRGNTLNVLMGYRHAWEKMRRSARLVHLIEEDIFVARDYFRFHERVQSTFDAFFVSALHNQNLDVPVPHDPSGVYYHHRYQSLGVSFRIEHLASIVPHATPAYFGDPAGHLRAKFPASRLPHECFEQDGLIDRIVERDGLRGLFPCTPRGYHAGFLGYNRPGFPVLGTLEERVRTLMSMNESQMNDHALVHKDIRQCPLDGRGVTDYVLREVGPL